MVQCACNALSTNRRLTRRFCYGDCAAFFGCDRRRDIAPGQFRLPSDGRTAQKNYLPLQAGDVPATNADTQMLHDWTGFAPATPVADGIARFVAWYRDYYRV